MLRRQTVRKIEYQRELLPLLYRLATLPISDKRSVNISNNVLRALSSESYYFAKQWQQQGYIRRTSRSKYSFIYAERLADKNYFKLLHLMQSLIKYLNKQGCSRQYCYELSVNPRKMRYKHAAGLNRRIIRMLRSNPNIALIQKELENTYYRASNNVHIHYIVLSTQPLPRRKIVRAVKRYGRRTTGSVTNGKMFAADNLKAAASYVTKQYGLPLPLKDNQFERFNRLPLPNKLQLLADDINHGKGIERHRLYVNNANANAAAWHRRISNKNYCRKHGVLIRLRHDAKETAKNSRSTVFGKAFGKIYHNARKKTSKHHYSEFEHWMQARYGNVDLAYKHHNVGVQTKLF